MATRKKNWDQLQGRDLQDTVKYRDVYEDQQLERSRIKEKQTMKSRQIITGVLTVFVMLVVYFAYTFMQFTLGALSGPDNSKPAGDNDVLPTVSPYYDSDYVWYDVDNDGSKDFDVGYWQVDEQGEKVGDEVYSSLDDVPVPDWYVEQMAELEAINSTKPDESADNDKANNSLRNRGFGYYLRPTFGKVVLSLIVGLLFAGIIYPFMVRNLEAQNLMNDTSDINQYQNDQHIALPEEVQRKFDWFPDVGAHCNVQVSSMISHVALSNKGLKKIPVAQRAKETIYYDDGDVAYEKGQVLLDDDGNVITKQMPLMDEKFMDALFEASGMPDDKRIRKYYDATQIPYNPDGKDRTKQGGKHQTVADMINAGWTFPEYEPQRPAGAYLVDTEPVNTMVLAITRAGKGKLCPVCSVTSKSYMLIALNP